MCTVIVPGWSFPLLSRTTTLQLNAAPSLGLTPDGQLTDFSVAVGERLTNVRIRSSPDLGSTVVVPHAASAPPSTGIAISVVAIRRRRLCMKHLLEAVRGRRTLSRTGG